MALFAFVDVNALTSNYMCIGGDGARGGRATIICIDELWQLTNIFHASKAYLDKLYKKVNRNNFLMLEWKPFFSFNFFFPYLLICYVVHDKGGTINKKDSIVVTKLKLELLHCNHSYTTNISNTFLPIRVVAS
jgi:hypothetical protein